MSRPIRSRRKRTIITPTILCPTVSDADTSRIVESIYLRENWQNRQDSQDVGTDLAKVRHLPRLPAFSLGQISETRAHGPSPACPRHRRAGKN
jgi:hypothetical protein